MTDNPYTPLFPLLLPRDDADGVQRMAFVVSLPAGMCPVSGNPLAGSALTLRFETDQYPEVYAVAGCARAAAAELIGGFAGDATRPAVRSMESACAHVARAVAVLFGCSVRYRAQLRIAVGGIYTIDQHIDGVIAP